MSGFRKLWAVLLGRPVLQELERQKRAAAMLRGVARRAILPVRPRTAHDSAT